MKHAYNDAIIKY